jgi:hypothetical protein
MVCGSYSPIVYFMTRKEEIEILNLWVSTLIALYRSPDSTKTAKEIHSYYSLKKAIRKIIHMQ